MCLVVFFFFFFFFQAEDGIRDLYVTGVQTCALPICDRGLAPEGVGAPERGDEGLLHGISGQLTVGRGAQRDGDRKSTRLNSSHVESSYAVFCLKKKNLPMLSERISESAPRVMPTRFV